MAAFDGRLYVMGGAGISITYEDIWSSADSAAWQQVTISASWGAWSSHAVAVLQNTLFLSGGGETNDVWSSVDGVEWRQETASPNWSDRENFAVSILPSE